METIRKITIHAHEIKKDKQTFPVFSANVNGKWIKVKFTKECENAPRAKGLYDLTIDFDNCSLERGKPFTAKDGSVKFGNPTIWVRAITSIRKCTEEELNELNRKKMVALFDSEDDEGLTF